MLRNTIKSLFIVSALLILLAGPAIGEIVSKVAAVVNDTIITTYQLNQATNLAATQDPSYSGLNKEEMQDFRLKVLDKMIEDELIRQRAKQLGLSVSDAEIEATINDVQEQNKLTRLELIAALEQQGMSFEVYRNNMRTKLQGYRLVGSEVQGKIDVSSQEVRDYYEEHIQEYRDQPYVRLSNLMFSVEEDATPGEIAAIQSKAEKARARLMMGDSIADLLVTYSEASGGDMGQLKESDLATTFTDAISTLQSGEISEIVKTPGSLFIFKMDERNNGNPKPLDAVRPEIENILLEKTREEAFKEWQKDLRDNAYIDIRI